MAGLVYYSSASGNTERFMHKLGLPAMRIPVDESAPMPEPDAPFVLAHYILKSHYSDRKSVV